MVGKSYVSAKALDFTQTDDNMCGACGNNNQQENLGLAGGNEKHA